MPVSLFTLTDDRPTESEGNIEGRVVRNLSECQSSPLKVVRYMSSPCTKHTGTDKMYVDDNLPHGGFPRLQSTLFYCFIPQSPCILVRRYEQTSREICCRHDHHEYPPQPTIQYFSVHRYGKESPYTRWTEHSSHALLISLISDCTHSYSGRNPIDSAQCRSIRA